MDFADTNVVVDGFLNGTPDLLRGRAVSTITATEFLQAQSGDSARPNYFVPHSSVKYSFDPAMRRGTAPAIRYLRQFADSPMHRRPDAKASRDCRAASTQFIGPPNATLLSKGSTVPDSQSSSMRSPGKGHVREKFWGFRAGTTLKNTLARSSLVSMFFHQRRPYMPSGSASSGSESRNF